MAFGTLDSDDDEVMSEINMTPLVDVMLVLLIIFIITIPVINHAVKIDLPRATNQPNDTKPAEHQRVGRRAGQGVLEPAGSRPGGAGTHASRKPRNSSRNPSCTCARTARSVTSAWPRSWPPRSTADSERSASSRNRNTDLPASNTKGTLTGCPLCCARGKAPCCDFLSICDGLRTGVTVSEQRL